MSRCVLLLMILICAAPLYARVPVTGRVQHMIYSRMQVQAAAARAYHRQLAGLAAKGELDNNPGVLQRVRKICSRLIPQAIRLKPAAADWQWEVHVTSDPEVAAFSMAGGKILVGTDFIDSYRLSDNELAVVLGHEIAHVIAEHVREQVSLAASFNKSLPPRSRDVADVISAMQSDISIYIRLLPLSRLQEMEADDIGIEMAAQAGIPPSAVTSFYVKMGKHDGRGESMFDTHGGNAQRIRFAESMASYAGPVFQASRGAKPLPGYSFSKMSSMSSR